MMKSQFAISSLSAVILKVIRCLLLLASLSPLTCLAEESTRHFPAGTQAIFIPKRPHVNQESLQKIAPLIEQSIADGHYPGAVILAGHQGKIIYRGVFGNRRIKPNIAPMTFDTIFDLASLTKALVTTTAIMQLEEQGKIRLDDPVALFWPDFACHGKGDVTIRQLLTHTSGFAAGLTCSAHDPNHLPCPCQLGDTITLNRVELQPLVNPPGTVFKYSDINFIALGHLVEIVSKEPLNKYAKTHIFNRLGLKQTFYLPSEKLKDRIAPTEIVEGKLRWGEVHDDTAYEMGGVSGMAGVFSTAKDLGIFAQCLLDGGRIPVVKEHKHFHYLLYPMTILKMTIPQTPAFIRDIRGLGWDIASRFATRGRFSENSFGHTGFTGTSIWIDAKTKTWLVILTSRTHPKPAATNPMIHDRVAIANLVADSIENK